MAECFTCKTQLQGSWNLTECGTSYPKTGRYLGIQDGYFLYGENPNWLYVYCKTCWKAEILKLAFVQEKIAEAACQRDKALELVEPLGVSSQDPMDLMRKQ